VTRIAKEWCTMTSGAHPFSSLVSSSRFRRCRVTATGSSKKGQTACMCHGWKGMVVALVGLHRRGQEQGPVELPDLEISIWIRVLPLLSKGLQGSVLVRCQSSYSWFRSGETPQSPVMFSCVVW